MGTIICGGNLYEEDIICKFKKAIGATHQKLSRTERIKNKMDGESKKVYEFGYNSSAFGYVQGNFFHLSFNPRPFFHPLHRYKLTFHMSQFENMKELVDRLIFIFGTELAWIICFEAKILRIDVWVDLDISFETMKQSTYRDRIANKESYAAKRRTLYFGSRKGNKQSLIYEKLRKEIPRSKIDYKHTAQNRPKHLLRVENRFKHCECPITAICNFSSLAEANVFNFPQVLFFDEEIIMESNEISNRQKTMLRPFFDDINSGGLQFAREQINEGKRNYKSRIEPILKQFGVDPQLNTIWKEKVESQIVAGFDIDEYFNELLQRESDCPTQSTPKSQTVIEYIHSPSALRGD